MSSVKRVTLGTARYEQLAAKAKTQCLVGVLDLLQYLGADLEPRQCPDDWPFAETTAESAEIESLDAAKAAFEQLKGLVVAILEFVDEATRARFIQEYVSENAATVESAIDALELSASLLDDFDVVIRRSSLAEPYLALREWLTIQSNAEAMAMAMAMAKAKARAIHERLDGFDRWRASGGASVNSRAIRTAHAELTRLAADDLSADEYLEILRNLKDSAEAIKEAAESLEDI